MAEEKQIKKIATRESYGNALKELADEFPNLVVLDADLVCSHQDRYVQEGIS